MTSRTFESLSPQEKFSYFDRLPTEKQIEIIDSYVHNMELRDRIRKAVVIGMVLLIVGFAIGAAVWLF